MKSKIGFKLVLAVGTITILSLIVYSYFVLATQQRQLITLIERNANQISEMVIRSTRYDMLLNQTDRIHKIINDISQQTGIEKIRVFNKEGEIIYAAVPEEIGTMVDKKGEACYKCHTADQALERLSISDRTRVFVGKNGTRTLGIINPIYNEPGCWQAECHAHEQNQMVLGVLDITMSLADVDESIHASQLRLAGFALLAIGLVSICLSLLVRLLIDRPVRQLVDATKIVAGGDLSYRIPAGRKDELGHLADSFNIMMHKLRDAQQQIYQQDKLASIGRLAAGVAHEINNPLTGVLSYSSFLLKRAEDHPDWKSDLEVIVKETKRCREIVKGLLDFARQAPASKSEFNLNDTITRTLAIMKNRLKTDEIDLILNLDETLPVVLADANQIEQVLLNLLINAADALTGITKEIRVETSVATHEGAQMVVARVSDTGTGIASENLTKIFEPFFTTKGQKGNGLGLAIVWGIIQKHNGTIHVDSKENVDTTFTVKLPLK